MAAEHLAVLVDLNRLHMGCDEEPLVMPSLSVYRSKV